MKLHVKTHCVIMEIVSVEFWKGEGCKICYGLNVDKSVCQKAGVQYAANNMWFN